jgi:molybdopterin molybdotransferase
MDGYACRAADLNQPLTIIETIPAGKEPEKTIEAGCCSQIMTGAPVPEGADTVIKVEDTEINDQGKVVFTGKPGKSNIASKSEDVSKGDVLIDEGTIIEPQHLAVMAATGFAKPQVAVKPRLAIISTGDEIVEPDEKPGISKIRNSNSYQLIGQAIKCGAEPHYMGIARDDEFITYEIIRESLESHDIIILTGGISMGKFDFIPAVFKKLGVEVLFQTLAIQPGKPTLFGKIGKKRIFGLPGNPVSAFNTFDLLVKPYVRLSMGAEIGHHFLKLPMGTVYTRKKTDRDSFIPVRIEESKVFPIEYHGSAHIQAITTADGFIKIPIGKEMLKAGEFIDVRQI